jgi:hypothetical protein
MREVALNWMVGSRNGLWQLSITFFLNQIYLIEVEDEIIVFIGGLNYGCIMH